ncbi:MAG: hypothetical protein Q9M45_07140 [Robiginitomaculum sp.]|nr:hypothetical protein [Robiginitomaculum sp.]
MSEDENPTLDAIAEAVKALAARTKHTGVQGQAPRLPGLHPVSARDEEHYRMLEALMFAAAEPLDMETIRTRLPGECRMYRFAGPHGTGLCGARGKSGPGCR